jgi:NADH-quinone oxidoreductase subunit L
MGLPLAVLAALSVVGGFINVPHIWGGHSALASYLNLGEDAHGPAATEWGILVGLMALALVSAGVAWLLYVKKPELSRAIVHRRLGAALHAASLGGFGIDRAYNTFIVRPLLWVANAAWFIVDVVIIDGLLVSGVAGIAQGVGALARRVQTGYVASYALVIAGGTILVLAYLISMMS